MKRLIISLGISLFLFSSGATADITFKTLDGETKNKPIVDVNLSDTEALFDRIDKKPGFGTTENIDIGKDKQVTIIDINTVEGSVEGRGARLTELDGGPLDQVKFNDDNKVISSERILYVAVFLALLVAAFKLIGRPKKAGEGDVDWPIIKKTNQTWEAEMIKNRLESENIPCTLTGESNAAIPLTVGYIGEINIRVPAEHAETAKSIISDTDSNS